MIADSFPGGPAYPCHASADRSAGHRPGQVPFPEHIELLHLFLSHRADIVERIQELLNAQRKPIQHLQDGPLLSRQFEDCFFSLPVITESHWRLRGQLEDAHWASGFRPRRISGLHNGLAAPAELMMRGFHLWRETRWPGRNGRVRYAQTLFNLYVVQCLAMLSMRLWDDAPGNADDRLSHVRRVLDRLWASTTADQPVLVRDARWLIPMAQSPATDDLEAYFDVAEQVDTLADADRIEVHKAGVCMTGGHLRSQIRYHAIHKELSLDDSRLTLLTRTSNALDFALLIQELAPLLEAYERAWHNGEEQTRVELADAICQGISPDPDLFVNHVELLGAYSMIEHLFIATDGDGHAVYAPMGRRHVRLLQDYAARVGRVAKPLYDDCRRFRPVPGAYSPYGVLYGFSTHLIEHMVLKTVQSDAITRFSLEDVFVSSDTSAATLEWVTGWRKLPHIKPEVERVFEYPQQFAEDMFTRIEDALRRRAADVADRAPVQIGRLLLHSGEAQADSSAPHTPELPARYIGSSDAQLVAAHQAEWCDEARLLSDRQEGRCLVCYKTSGGWVAVTKDVLTEVLGAGRDIRIAGLPAAAAEVLTLMCPELKKGSGSLEEDTCGR